MAYTLSIHNESNNFRAEIVPVHGGMVAQLYLEDRALLRIDRSSLEMSPMAAGGMPILFPFPSKMKDDHYTLGGKTYYMPMHGLVKNAPFAVKEATDHRVTLWIGDNPAWVEGCYPFCFRLEVTYEVRGTTLFTSLAVTNNSKTPMPHCLGWHPFFYSSDKTHISLEHSMEIHYDYINCIDTPAKKQLDLSTRLDDVFHTPSTNSFTLDNLADGYEVVCRFDPLFQSMVVCSFVPESMCIEPWLGLPDSMNQNRFLRWIDPGETETYNMELEFRGK